MKIQGKYIDKDITVKVRVGGVNTSFTQVYDCIGLLSVLLTQPHSRSFLDVVLERMSNDNIFKSDDALFKAYNDRLLLMGQEIIGRSTYQRNITDLISAFMILPIKSRSGYMVNPFIAWKGQPRERKVQLSKYALFNPLTLNK